MVSSRLPVPIDRQIVKKSHAVKSVDVWQGPMRLCGLTLCVEFVGVLSFCWPQTAHSEGGDHDQPLLTLRPSQSD